jgi:hypothetical protein
MFLVYLLLGILLIVGARLFFIERDNMKLKERNRLLCRENHKLRLKQKEHEDGTKG